jgi:hypothetical protein
MPLEGFSAGVLDRAARDGAACGAGVAGACDVAVNFGAGGGRKCGAMSNPASAAAASVPKMAGRRHVGFTVRLEAIPAGCFCRDRSAAKCAA